MTNLVLQAAAGGSSMSFLIMMVAIFAIMWFFMIRPQQKKHRKSIKKGRIPNQESRTSVRTSSFSSPPLTAKYSPINGRKKITLQITP